MKLNNGLYFIGVVILVYFVWVQVRPAIIRSNCYRQIYQLRINENNYEWADGKGWHPTDVDGVSGPYQWIYFDQSSMYSAQKAKVEREQNQLKNYEKCLLSHGLKN